MVFRPFPAFGPRSRRAGSLPFSPASIGGPSIPGWVIPGASIDADFVNDRYYGGAFASMFSEVRSTSKYARNTAGLLNLFAVDTIARTDYGVSQEPAATNLLIQSEFAASWTAQNGTLTPSAVASPTGATTAATFVESNAAASAHNFFNTSTFTISSGTNYAVSMYVKQSTRRYTTLVLFGNANHFVSVNYDLQSASVAQVAVGSSSGTHVSSSITQLGTTGWYRLVLVGSVGVTTGQMIGALANAATFTPDAAGRQAYNGDGTSGNSFFGAQWELGTAATSYIPTTTTSASRSVDNISIIGVALAAGIASSGWAIVEAGLGVYTASAFLLGGSGASDYYIRQGSGGATTLNARLGGAAAATATIGGAASLGSNIVKAGVTWDANNVTVVGNNGTANALAQSLVLPAGLSLGSRGGTSPSNLFIRRLTFGSGYIPSDIGAKTA